MRQLRVLTFYNVQDNMSFIHIEACPALDDCITSTKCLAEVEHTRLELQLQAN